MTRKEVETELLKLPAHTEFRRFNTHLANSEAPKAITEATGAIKSNASAPAKPKAPAKKKADKK